MILKNKNTKNLHDAIKVTNSNSIMEFIDKEDILDITMDGDITVATIRTYSTKENKALKNLSYRVAKTGQYIVKERFGVHGVLNDIDIERGYEIVKE